LTDYAEDNDGNGRPWRAFYSQFTGRVVAIVSRSRTGYELLWADRTSVHAEKIDDLVLVARVRTARLHASA
jgi:hypothetical protein